MRVLIVIAGLLRNWELGLESLHRRVLLANPKADFDFALLTSLTSLASYRDHSMNRPVRGTLPKDGSRTIQQEMMQLAPNSSLVFQLISPYGLPRRRDNATGRLIQVDCAANLARCMRGGWPQWAKRLPTADTRKPFVEIRLAHGLHEMAKDGLLKRYDKVLALRPDVALTKDLPLQETCAKYPGVNLIGGNFTRILKGWPHERDIDLAFLGCNVTGLQTYFFPYYDMNATARGDPRFRKAYKIQTEFRPRLNEQDCKPLYGFSRFECMSIQLMREAGIRLGTLDKARIFVDLLGGSTAPGSDETLAELQAVVQARHNCTRAHLHALVHENEMAKVARHSNISKDAAHELAHELPERRAALAACVALADAR